MRTLLLGARRSWIVVKSSTPSAMKTLKPASLKERTFIHFSLRKPASVNGIA
jgi:hypothetical protein